MRRLLESGRALVADLDPQAVLERALAAAREVTGAGYAALGILDERRAELEQFLTLGDDADTRPRDGDLPPARQVVDMLVADPTPLRLTHLDQSARLHPSQEAPRPEQSFLGVPVLIRGTPWGALYLTGKQGDDFSEADEEAAVILADWAGTAIENAHRYQHSEQRQAEHDRTLDDAEARHDVTIRVGGETGLERVLDLIVERGRDLIDARPAGATGAAGAGGAAGAAGAAGAGAGGAAGAAGAGASGVGGAAAGAGGAGDDDAELLRAFAVSAATAVAMAQSAESDRLRSLMAAADAERSRWARELHDDTLQGLGAVRLLLAAARRRGDTQQTAQAVDEAIGYIEQEIDNLHAIISDLRPAALDELGLGPALEALLDRRSGHGTLSIASQLVLPNPDLGEARLGPEIESTVYRVVQEALTNIVKHANATEAAVFVTVRDGVSIEVRDDGGGFASRSTGAGFGLAGMRERVNLAGGTVRIDSGPNGTRVRAEIPARAHGRAARSP
jgi:signal transduction histidine kinase